MSIPNNELYGGILGAGRIAEHHPAEYIISKIAQGVVPFGVAVVKGSVDEQAKLPSSASDKMLGIAAYSTDAGDLDNEKYIDGDPMGVVETGIVVVKVEEAVNIGDPVRVRHGEDTRAGSQAWGFTTTKNGSSNTGLENDTTKYGAIVVIDGVAKEVVVVGSACQTIANLITKINANLGSAATAALVDNTIKITSATSGASSSVRITDGNDSANQPLFASLTDIKSAPDDPVPGSDDIDPAISPGNLRTSAIAGKTAVLSGAAWKSATTGPGLAILYVKGPFSLTADV
jgi:hypothetical protein